MLPLLLRTQAELYDEKTVDLNCAQSWSLVSFLWHDENGRYAKCLQQYFRALNRGAGIPEAFRKRFGKTDLRALEDEWKRFTLGL